MNEYWIDSGVLWRQIVRAIYRSKKVLLISEEGISVDGGEPYELCGGAPTIDQLENILRDSI